MAEREHNRSTFDLGRILERHALKQRGVSAEITKATGIRKVKVSKMMNGTATRISFEELSSLCAWLGRKGLSPRDVGGLFFKTWVWNQLSTSRKVRLFLGEKCTPEGTFMKRWLALDDVEVLRDFLLALSPDGDGKAPAVALEYVPMQLTASGKLVDFASDRDSARRIFDGVRAREGDAHVIVGSQRANLVSEFFVADLWGVSPFNSPRSSQRRVPFFLKHRDPSSPLSRFESCMGGCNLPAWWKGTDRGPGIYFGRTGFVKWDASASDSSVVITRSRGSRGLDVAVIGFTGRSTRFASREFIDHPEEFPPDGLGRGGDSFGAYVCQFTIDATTNGSPNVKCEVFSLAEH